MLYEHTKDQGVKDRIKSHLQASMINMLKTCDGNWNCGHDWLNGSPNTVPNLHFQMNAMELINAYYKTFFSGQVSVQAAAPTSKGSNNYVPPPPFNAADKQVVSFCLIITLTCISNILFF